MSDCMKLLAAARSRIAEAHIVWPGHITPIVTCGTCALLARIDALLKSGDEYVMVPREPVAWIYRVNNAHDCFSDMKPPDDAYDKGTLVPLYAAAPLPQKEGES